MGKHILLKINHRKYKKLKDNVFAIVDNEDYERIIKIGNWRLGNPGYAEISTSVNGKAVSILMHREIMKAKKGKNIDHIDGNPLNNQKSNLRYATMAQNAWNRKGIDNSSSKYKGVSWAKTVNKWYACIKKHGKNKNLGLYDNEIDAAKAYDAAAILLYKEYARLNINQ